jgi:hypothetical protein
MSPDLELAEWRTDWLANGESDSVMLRPDLRLLVDRKRRRMLLAVVGQLLFHMARVILRRGLCDM